MTMKIRVETPNDYDAVLTLVSEAFKTANVSDGGEADLVQRVRAGKNYIPELTFVGEIDGKIIGFVMLSHTVIKNPDGDFKTIILAPVCTRESYRNNGLGGQLIKTAIRDAIALGYTSLFLVGDRNYYERFGFVPIRNFGLTCNYDIPVELMDNVMGLELSPGALHGVSGMLDLEI